MSISGYDKWLHSYTSFIDEASSGVELCPSCGASELNVQFVAKTSDRMGFAFFWCGSCLKGIQISRLKVPEQFEFISMNSDLSLLKELVPDFEQIDNVDD